MGPSPPAALRFDDAASRRLLISYRTPEIARQRRQVVEAVAPQPGERLLDIGCGPGLLARELGVRVGPGGSVAGLDLSEDMLALGAELGPPPGNAAPISYVTGDATALPYPDRSFDAVVSTQVYEYVPDMPRALAEAIRVLRPGGRIVILDTDWDSLVWHATDERLHARVLTAWDEHLADPHLPRKLPGLLRDAGFEQPSCEVIALLNQGYRVDMFSAHLIVLVTAFVPGHAGVTEADADAWAANLTALGADYFFSINRYLFTAERPPG
jgi:ubiquinone/menaquinone biosynthesis C-methylase UbiE